MFLEENIWRYILQSCYSKHTTLEIFYCLVKRQEISNKKEISERKGIEIIAREKIVSIHGSTLKI